jgi:hypothetical protein
MIFDTSTRTLKLLASLVWYSGAVVLYFKSAGLLIEAWSMNSGQLWVWLAALGGIVIGVIKAKCLFKRLCIKNLRRIDALDRPKLWHFYRLRFFAFLFAMVALGHYLSGQVHGNYPMLLTMIVIELSVATALFGSSSCFWKKQVCAK